MTMLSDLVLYAFGGASAGDTGSAHTQKHFLHASNLICPVIGAVTACCLLSVTPVPHPIEC